MSEAYQAVPEELRLLKNWCLWKYVKVEGSSKLTKVPYQPNGHKCNVTDSKTFSTFGECHSALRAGGYDGLGFIFTDTPYTGIDLDDPNGDDIVLQRQIKIYQEFNSYSEV